MFIVQLVSKWRAVEKKTNNEEFKEQKLNGTHDSEKKGPDTFSDLSFLSKAASLSKSTWKDRFAIVIIPAITASQTI